MLIKCPFCGKYHMKSIFPLNIICGCGAKFYGNNKTWLNRKTGEMVEVSGNE